MATSAPRTARALAREHLTAAILTEARRQLTLVGPAELSVRAIARELGMASSAVYRYVASRDELITALLVQVYTELGEVAEASEQSATDPADLAGRWLALCHAIRDWALAHPHDYALLYGSPVPGYAAPQDTVPAAGRVTGAFMRILQDAPARPDEPTPSPVLATSVAPLVALMTPRPTEQAVLRGLLAWSAVFGTISFELFGHLVGAVADTDGYADEAFRELARFLLLTP